MATAISKDTIVLEPEDERIDGLERDWSYYYVQAFIILPIRAVTPLSWSLVVFELWRNGSRMVSKDAWLIEKLVVICALIEVLFSLYHHQQVMRLFTRAANVDKLDFHTLTHLFERIIQIGLHPKGSPPPARPFPSQPGTELSVDQVPELSKDDPRAVDFRASTRTWFGRRPWSALSRPAMREWLAWSMFNARHNHLAEDQQDIIERALVMIEKRAGTSLPHEDAKRPGLQPIRLTLDPMSVQSRPLFVYLIFNSIGFWVRWWFEKNYGVVFKQIGSLEVMIRPPAPSTEDLDHTSGSFDKTPIIFLHGLGIGISQYYQLLRDMFGSPSLRGRVIIVPLQPHISQQFWHSRHLEPPLHRTAVRDLKATIDHVAKTYDLKNGNEKPTLLSHSNGTVWHTWLLKAYPELFKKSCLVDPVTMCTWEGDVCYNFVYRPPRRGIEALMRYFVGREIGVANYIQRNFDWSSNTLFFEDVPNVNNPRRALFVLGGKDSILQAARVKKYLNDHGVVENVVFKEEAMHGEALMAGGETLDAVMRWLEEDV